MELQPGQPIDRYVVERPLGRGGMAAVYLVRHAQLGSRHALKVLLSPHPGIQQRLLQEGRAQSQLRHRHIVAVTDIVTILGAPGLVMDYVDGPTLRDFLAERRLTWAEADVLGRGLLGGIAAAHDAGVVHRDLKPANVLLAWSSESWVPQIADFGVAKIVGAQQTMATRTGAGLGTPAYMAPEQTYDASKVDHRADVFAAGAILFELVTGQRAFRGDDLVEVYTAVREGRRPAVHELAPDTPARLVDAIDAALQVDPDDRPATAQTLLERWVAGEPLPEVAWEPPAERLQAFHGEVTGETQTPTFSWTGEGSEETFDPRPREHTLPSMVAPAVPVGEGPARARRWPVGAAVAVACLMAASVAWWAWPEGPPVLGVGDVPEVLDGRAQESLVRGWTSLLEADDVAAERHLLRAVEEAPEAPEPWAALAWSRARQGKQGEHFVALWKAVELADGRAGPHAEALRALGRRRRLGWSEEDELLALADANPDDLLIGWLASRALPREEHHQGTLRFQRARDAHGGSPLVHDQLAGWLAVTDPWRAEAAARQGLDRFPGNPALLVTLGEVLVARGRYDEARTHLTEGLRFAPGLFRARHRLAELALVEGDEATAQALIEASFASTEPIAQQTAFAYRLGLALAGMGRVAEAEVVLRRGADAAAGASAFTAKGWLLGMVALIEMDAGRFDRALAATEEMTRFAATAPEIPEGERAALARHMMEGRAMLAGRRGALDEAEELLARLEQIDGMRQESLEWTRRELAVQRGDLEALPGLFEHAPDTCASAVERARCYDVAGDPATARSLLDELFADPDRCGAIGEDRWASAHGRVRAARLALDAGQPDVARAHLAVHESLWPRPDRSLPVVEEARRLTAALETPRVVIARFGVELEGGTEHDVYGVVEDMLPGLRACYAGHLDTQPELTGDLFATMWIERGAVLRGYRHVAPEGAPLVGGTLNVHRYRGPLEDCLWEALDGLRFGTHVVGDAGMTVEFAGR